MTTAARCSHSWVGAGAVGVLAAGEAGVVADHVAECPACAAELRELGAAVAILSDIDAAPVPDGAPRLGRQLPIAVLLVVVLAVLVGSATLVGAYAGVNSRGPAAGKDLTARTSAASATVPRRVAEAAGYTRARDSRTGLAGGIALTSGPRGTDFTLFAGGVPASVKRIRLVAVTLAGSSTTVDSWAVPASSRALRVAGHLPVSRADLDRVELRSPDDDRPLLTIPVS
jgi:hypothetical protein